MDNVFRSGNVWRVSGDQRRMGVTSVPAKMATLSAPKLPATVHAHLTNVVFCPSSINSVPMDNCRHPNAAEMHKTNVVGKLGSVSDHDAMTAMCWSETAKHAAVMAHNGFAQKNSAHRKNATQVRQRPATVTPVRVGTGNGAVPNSIVT